VVRRDRSEPDVRVERIAEGAYRVEQDGRMHTVFVAGAPGSRWAFFNGRMYREEAPAAAAGAHVRRPDTALPLTAPMPATVLKILALPGATVSRGDTLIILEAMKMELPLRASADGVVAAIHCREGELVQPETVLIELR
jgi:3-methylcrotonyl-CoA carboxylase alpha subunit